MSYLDAWKYEGASGRKAEIERSHDQPLMHVDSLSALTDAAPDKLQKFFEEMVQHGLLHAEDRIVISRPTGKLRGPKLVYEDYYTLDAVYALGFQLAAKELLGFRVWHQNQIRASTTAASDYMESHFKDKKGSPTLHPCYVVFADLLGYKNLILSSDRENRGNLLRVRSALEMADAFLNSDSERPATQVRYYSDCVTLITPLRDYDDMYGESAFGSTVMSLMAWQLQMVLGGFFVRGGISAGDMYADRFALFGKPHLEAYDLETKTAVQPRIVLSDFALALVKGQMGYYAEDYPPPHESHLLVDSDNQVFVNYLNAASPSNYNFGGRAVKKHGKIVEKALQLHSGTAQASKYEWCARYHNWYCTQPYSVHRGWDKYTINSPTASFGSARAFLGSPKLGDPA